MSTVFFILMLISMAAVLGVLITGLVVMGKGGALNEKYGNKLMQTRVLLQGFAIVFFLLAIMTRGS